MPGFVFLDLQQFGLSGRRVSLDVGANIQIPEIAGNKLYGFMTYLEAATETKELEIEQENWVCFYAGLPKIPGRNIHHEAGSYLTDSESRVVDQQYPT